ncbi:UNVERIFIED_CONTAM: hypothetical protein HDU68_011284 [Siphonaria sp. JEL0065]|nr:hypothetical protein HDU68_011284 [Siphonaria sp. JEL0065]
MPSKRPKDDSLGFFAPATIDSDDERENAPLKSGQETGADGQAELMDIDEATAEPLLNNHLEQQQQQLSLSALNSNAVSKLAAKTWLKKAKVSLDRKLVDSWATDLTSDADLAVLLDKNSCLEKYLWPLFPATPTTNHVLVVVALFNEQFRDRVVDPWSLVTGKENAAKFSVFFKHVLKLIVNDSLSLEWRKALLVFLIHAFQSLENQTVRVEALKIVGISIWHSLRDAEKLELEFAKEASLRKAWNKAEKKRSGASEEDVTNEQYFVSSLIKLYYKVLSIIPEKPTLEHRPAIEFCDRAVEFFTDLLSQLPTRRYLTVLLKDHFFAQTSHSSSLAIRGNASVKAGVSHVLSGSCFVQLLELYDLYESFEIDDVSGASVSKDDATAKHYVKLQALQKLVFTKYREHLEDFALKPVSVVESTEAFVKHFQELDVEILRQICTDLGFRTAVVGGENEDDEEKAELYDAAFLVDALARTYCERTRQLDLINSVSVYPNETDLFDDIRSPNSFHFQNTHCLPIPKLNLQFLTMHDYLLRNFNLYRLETAYEIRQDVEDAIKRLAPKYTPDVDSLSGSTVFTGWARMAAPIERFEISEVGTPALGETKPSFVMGEVSFVIGKYSDSIRREWESLKRHDVLFLITIEMDSELPSWSTDKSAKSNKNKKDLPFKKQFGIKHIRGCVVVDELDADGKLANEADGEEDRVHGKGGRSYKRTLRVSLDTNQYERDMVKVNKKEAGDLHRTFNVILRRKPQENNFKSVLESIRDLMQSSEIVVPDWLQDVVLGYGDPSSANFKEMKNPVSKIDFRDTFLSWEHAVESFPEFTLKPTGALAEFNDRKPPFVLTFPNNLYSALKDSSKLGKRKHESETKKPTKEDLTIQVDTYKPLNMGPFPEDARKLNAIPFTPKQIEAIHAGTSPGLTMVVGPPGTGKTDLTVQIIANIYHNFPNEKTLLVTHSNQALNQLFEKIVALDIDERHVLRLGHGTEALENAESWGKYGRVNSFLEKRIALLAQIDVLAASLNLPGAYGSTCETAENFFNQHIARLWDRYTEIVENPQSTLQDLANNFPFHYYFAHAPLPLFYESQTLEDAKEVVAGCFRHIRKIFTELEEVRAFELLRNNHDRSNYLLMKEAKIIALTCTHAALKRRELVALGFKYHNVIMEEAAQILEVEAFIPLLLQSPDQDTGSSRLKRVVMIGDHHQLPPIVQNSAFQKYGNMEQSLFTRLVRLGVPTIELDQQGRCRPELADLFRWNYSSLKDLGGVVTKTHEFQLANAGFAFDYQFVNVEDYNGKGETEPIPHFLQNLGEAEYVVATYQYMRLLGYPAEKITILTTYNGQKALIEDVLEKRCRWNPLFGLPNQVVTVDKFQGQQNDYILLSLVRTKTVGHLRDVRRLIVALSRARLGLYIFGRRSLFDNCFELQPAFTKLVHQRPSDGFWLRGQEIWEADEFTRLVAETGVSFVGKEDKGEWKAEAGVAGVFEIKDIVHMGSYVHQMIVEQVEYMKEQKAKQSEDVEMVEEIDE